MLAISKQLGVSRHKVYWWINKYEIQLRTKSQQSYLQHDIFNDTHQLIVPSDTNEYFLMGLGLGLYWGEGNKADPYAIRLGNTDPKLIIAFLNFLEEICGVRESKIRFGLQVFNDIDENVAIEYWMKQLNRKRDSFHQKIIVSPPQGKGTYRNKSKYGVIQIYVSDKRLKEALMKKIAEIVF